MTDEQQAEQNFLSREPIYHRGIGNEAFNVGEVVVDMLGNRGVVVRRFSRTGLYVLFPQYDVAQLVKATDVYKF